MSATCPSVAPSGPADRLLLAAVGEFAFVGKVGDRTLLAAFPADKLFIGQLLWALLVLATSWVLLWRVVPAVLSRRWFVDLVEQAVGLVGTALLAPEDWLLSRPGAHPGVRRAAAGYGMVVARIFDLLTTGSRVVLTNMYLLGPPSLTRDARPIDARPAPDQPAGPHDPAPSALSGLRGLVPFALAAGLLLGFLWWNQARCVPSGSLCTHPIKAWLSAARRSGGH